MHHHQTTNRRSLTRRGGYTAPLVVAALLVVLACTALVLDTLWLEGVTVELRRTAEASALAAAGELASDDLLRKDADPALRVGRARLKAAEIAAQNLVAGDPLMLVVDPENERGDIRIGKEVLDEESGDMVFLDTFQKANQVRVKGERSRSRWNPVALFLQGISGQPHADVVEMAQAGINNRLAGLRPYEGVAVPALPLAILQKDPGFKRKDTWNIQIEQRKGADKYSWHASTGEVQQRPDGIPEIVLTSMKRGGKPSESNVMLVDLNTDFRHDRLADQIRLGWTAEDLARHDGKLEFGQGAASLVCSPTLGQDVAESLKSQIGQPRICLLYTEYRTTGKNGFGTLLAVRPVAGRIMAIESNENGACRIVFQPAVVTTRTALLAEENGEESSDVEENPYIYKLQLTR